MRAPRSILRSSRLQTGTDQAVSAVSNLMVLVVAAHTTSQRNVGFVALILAIYAIAVGLVRASVLDPMLLRLLPLEYEEVVTAIGCYAGLAGSSVALVVVALGPMGLHLGGLAFVAALPGLLVQDAVRYVGFGRSKPWIALASDTSWVAAFAGTVMLGAIWKAQLNADFLISAWVGCAVFAAGVGVACGSIKPAFLGVSSLRKALGRFHFSLLVDYAVGAGVTQITFFVLTGLVGLAGIGIYRSAQALFGPTNILFSAVYVRLLPVCAQLISVDFVRAQRRILEASLALTSVGVAATAFWFAAPDIMGHLAFGRLWHPMVPLVLPIGVSTVFGGLTAGATIGLRSLSSGRQIIVARAYSSVFAVSLVAGGAAVGHLQGAAIGTAASAAATAAIYWLIYWRTAETQRCIRTMTGGEDLHHSKG